MNEPPKIQWPGKSGTEYTYWIFPRGTTFNDAQPGNYIHAKETKPGHYRPIYIGQTHDLNERLCHHEQQQCVDRNGATHVCVHVNKNGEQARLSEEKDLIRHWQPVCNTQHCD